MLLPKNRVWTCFHQDCHTFFVCTIIIVETVTFRITMYGQIEWDMERDYVVIFACSQYLGDVRRRLTTCAEKHTQLYCVCSCVHCLVCFISRVVSWPRVQFECYRILRRQSKGQSRSRVSFWRNIRMPQNVQFTISNSHYCAIRNECAFAWECFMRFSTFLL